MNLKHIFDSEWRELDNKLPKRNDNSTIFIYIEKM